MASTVQDEAVDLQHGTRADWVSHSCLKVNIFPSTNPFVIIHIYVQYSLVTILYIFLLCRLNINM